MSAVQKYTARGVTLWKIDTWIRLPNGRAVRVRRRKIPTRAMAEALVAKLRAEAFEGRYFERVEESHLTVAEAWEVYEPVTKRDNASWQSDVNRAALLVEHLGDREVMELTQEDVDWFRSVRLKEKTVRGRAPSAGTLDKEVELLKRFLNYAVKCGRIPSNPISHVKLLRKPNVRRSVITEAEFTKLVDGADAALKPILIVAFDTGMRIGEILDLQWDQVDLDDAVIRLIPQDTKGEEHRAVFLTERAATAVRSQLNGRRSGHVFLNPRTGKRWRDIRKKFRKAKAAAGLPGIWVHDLRRSFVTKARRKGIPESVVMRMSGHRTRSVFERYNVISEDDLREAVERLDEGVRGEAEGKVGQETGKVSGEPLEPETTKPPKP